MTGALGGILAGGGVDDVDLFQDDSTPGVDTGEPVPDASASHSKQAPQASNFSAELLQKTLADGDATPQVDKAGTGSGPKKPAATADKAKTAKKAGTVSMAQYSARSKAFSAALEKAFPGRFLLPEELTAEVKDAKKRGALVADLARRMAAKTYPGKTPTPKQAAALKASAAKTVARLAAEAKQIAALKVNRGPGRGGFLGGIGGIAGGIDPGKGLGGMSIGDVAAGAMGGL